MTGPADQTLDEEAPAGAWATVQSPGELHTEQARLELGLPSDDITALKARQVIL